MLNEYNKCTEKMKKYNLKNNIKDSINDIGKDNIKENLKSLILNDMILNKMDKNQCMNTYNEIAPELMKLLSEEELNTLINSIREFYNKNTEEEIEK